VGVYS